MKLVVIKGSDRRPVYVPTFRVGGMAGAIVTAPFDLVKTRLQSDTYVKEQQAKMTASTSNIVSKPASTVIERRGVLKLLHAFVETGHILGFGSTATASA